MSMNSEIIAAVQDIANCYPWEAYEGSEDEKNARYFVFDYVTSPCAFGDGEVPLEKYSIQLHYFCPRGDNTVALRRDVKNRIYATGKFTFPSEENVSDDDGQHYCFEFEGLDVT